MRLTFAVLIVGVAAVAGAPGSGAAGPGVSVSDQDFSPAGIKVAIDEPVVFTLTQSARNAHSITSDDGAFPEQKLDYYAYKDQVNLKLSKAGRYAYYCKYDGGKGGKGMSGVILVGDPAASSTTSTTAGPWSTTSSTATTTTQPPPTTTTTEPAAIQAFEAPPSAAPAPAQDPATPNTKAPKAPKPAPDPTTTTTKVKAASAGSSSVPPGSAAAPVAPAAPELPSLTSLLAPTVPTPATTASTAGGQTPENLALRLPDSGEGKPADGAGLLIAVAIVLLAVTAAGSGYAWHHRPSRYYSA